MKKSTSLLSGAPPGVLHQAELVPASDWTQRWRERRHSWRHASEGGFQRSRYDVVPITSDALAREFVELHHYSGSYPAARFRYGLYEDGELVGVVVLGVPSRNEVLSTVFPDLVPNFEVLELSRLTLLDQVPANAESFTIARVWELASREGIRGVVSFSDPFPRTDINGNTVFLGHFGTIYQASNALYLGRSAPRTIALLPNGQTLHERMLSKIRQGEVGYHYAEEGLVRAGARPRGEEEDRSAWLKEALVTIGVRRVRHPGKHRYAFRIGRQRTLIRVGLPSYPYPKAAAAA